MKRAKETSPGSKARLESQDDVGYLTGQRSPAEKEKQIRTPRPRESGEMGDRDYGQAERVDR